MTKRVTEPVGYDDNGYPLRDKKGKPITVTYKPPITKTKHRVGPVSLIKDIKSVLKKG